MVKERSNLVVYTLSLNEIIVYVGCGTLYRALSWKMPSKYSQLGLPAKPDVEIRARELNQIDAWQLEAKLIKRYAPKFNKARFGTSGGLKPWNSGKTKADDERLRGGRPRGIPTSLEHRQKLSTALKGRAKEWMTGRTPWNKGLTKTDPRVAKGVQAYSDEKRTIAAGKTWNQRRSSS